MPELDTADAGIDVWYQNPNTGIAFGFGTPLPPQIGPQIANGNLVRCAGPDGSEPPAEVVLEADENDPAGPEQEAVLYPCQDCGEVAAQDDDGFYTDHCAKHTPKPTGARSAKKA